MCVVITVAIIESQDQRNTSIKNSLFALMRWIQLFKRSLQVHQAIITTQVEQLTTQISTNRTMVIE
jgi:hypothetical protein